MTAAKFPIPDLDLGSAITPADRPAALAPPPATGRTAELVGLHTGAEVVFDRAMALRLATEALVAKGIIHHNDPGARVVLCDGWVDVRIPVRVEYVAAGDRARIAQAAEIADSLADLAEEHAAEATQSTALRIDAMRGGPVGAVDRR